MKTTDKSIKGRIFWKEAFEERFLGDGPRRRTGIM